MTDEDGNVVWLADYNAWGGVSDICKDFSYVPQTVGNVEITADELQPIRFQGQFCDVETGLHYNRFRYYDCDVGMFISRDPIGLLGGNNVFAYAPNPTGWIDPWGLVKVGRWMGDTEYNDMINTKKVIESHSGTTHVALPENMNAYFKQAENGAKYVVFDIPDNAVKATSDIWGSIIGPNSLAGRLAKIKGLPIPEMPSAENIEVLATKEDGKIKLCSKS